MPSSGICHKSINLTYIGCGMTYVGDKLSFYGQSRVTIGEREIEMSISQNTLSCAFHAERKLIDQLFEYSSPKRIIVATALKITAEAFRKFA